MSYPGPYITVPPEADERRSPVVAPSVGRVNLPRYGEDWKRFLWVDTVAAARLFGHGRDWAIGRARGRWENYLTLRWIEEPMFAAKLAYFEQIAHRHADWDDQGARAYLRAGLAWWSEQTYVPAPELDLAAIPPDPLRQQPADPQARRAEVYSIVEGIHRAFPEQALRRKPVSRRPGLTSTPKRGTR